MCFYKILLKNTKEKKLIAEKRSDTSSSIKIVVIFIMLFVDFMAPFPKTLKTALVLFLYFLRLILLYIKIVVKKSVISSSG